MTQKKLLAFLSVSLLSFSLFAESTTFQQGNGYEGCSDCWIGDISSISGNHNTDRLCMLNEC